MTPGGRIAAVIELLAALEGLDRPADQIVSGYLRERRFIGSKDRRAITAFTYAFLRARARLGWWLARAEDDPLAGGAEAAARFGSPRARAISGLCLVERLSAREVAALFSGEGHAPPALDAREESLLARLTGQPLDHPDQPRAIRLETPDWLLERLEAAFGAQVETELAALLRPAPVDLRTNTLFAEGRESVAETLAEEGIATEPTPLSPLGLRAAGRPPVQSSKPFQAGLVELQDEGSQIVALLCDARAEMAVADLCAGAGGKTLALAAAMEDRGRLVSLDVSAARLARAAPRMKRAGATCVERRVLAGEGDPWWRKSAGRFDRVLVDAPCSGVGAWRRAPDARWRLSPEMLAGYRAAQGELLTAAADLIRPGGRLIYATCSLLTEENEDQVNAFLTARPDFAVCSMAALWAEVMGSAAPPGVGESGLRLSPAANGTDGFFVAVMERRSA